MDVFTDLLVLNATFLIFEKFRETNKYSPEAWSDLTFNIYRVNTAPLTFRVKN